MVNIWLILIVIIWLMMVNNYHLVMTNSWPWKGPPMLLIGKPSISSINGPCSMAMLNNQRVYTKKHENNSGW